MRQGAAVVTAKGEAGRIRGDGQSDTAAAAAAAAVATPTNVPDKDSRERPIQSLLSIQLPQLRWSEFYSLLNEFSQEPEVNPHCSESLLQV